MAADFLRARYADAAIAGGTDALCRLTYSGFNVLQAVDSNPCSPFHADRKGITLGEGAAYLVLERWDDATARGARIIAELGGYGATCDAYHPTAPHDEGRGAEAAMRGALCEARCVGVDYINAHGTGTLLNDSSETKAIMAAVGNNVPVSSSKSYFGHTLGASGAVEIEAIGSLAERDRGLSSAEQSAGVDLEDVDGVAGLFGDDQVAAVRSEGHLLRRLRSR